MAWRVHNCWKQQGSQMSCGINLGCGQAENTNAEGFSGLVQRASHLQQGAEVGDGVGVRGLVPPPGSGIPGRLEPACCFCLPLLLLPLPLPLLLLRHLPQCSRTG
jgi:hypothetical protein